MIVAFARKPQNLEEVISGCNSLKKSKIEMVIELDDLEFNKLTDDFYNSNPVFENMGGSMNGITYVIKITNTKTNQVIYVNPEGYDYARYVGLEVK